jgi:hypothetical protein
MSSWTAQRVLDAAAAMEFVPEGTIEVRTDDYRLVRHPDWMLGPALGAAQVTWSRTARPIGEVIGEVAGRVRGWSLPGVAWWVSAVSQPARTEEALQARGAGLIDAMQVLARELGEDLPPPEPPGGEVELVRDERTFRAALAVSVRGWGSAEPDEPEIARLLKETLQDLASWSSFRVVAIAGHEPVSVGGCTLAGAAGQEKIALLWGAITVSASRGHGSYRAVLAERLRLAREHGATLAMAKGRNLGSASILLRAGFTDYGEQRCYWLPVS